MAGRDDWLERDRAVIADAMRLRFFPFVVAEGDGARLIDVDGDEYVDFASAWAVANVGYCHPSLQERLREQLDRLTANSPLSLAHPPLIELAERLCELTPGSFEKKAWFGHSGSEAGDLVSKLLREADGDAVVTFAGSYHGQTAGAAAISGHAATGGGDEDVVVAPFPGGETTAAESIEAVETAFAERDVAGLITEPLQSDAGIRVPPEGFLSRVEELCAVHDAVFAVDEVKTGLGRTGRWFACERDGVTPDLVTLGKPLGSGVPISAVVGRADLLDSIPAGHMLTTAGNPLSAAAGLATLETLESDDLVATARETGERFRALLEDQLADLEHVGDVRGRGLMQGVELRDPEGDDAAFAAGTCYRASERGVVVFYVGIESNVLELTPPLSIDDRALETGVERLRAAIEDVADGAVSEADVEPYAGW